MKEINWASIGSVKEFFALVGEMTVFAFHSFLHAFRKPFEGAEILRQMFLMGYKSLFLISITIFIIGLVITIQLAPKMEDLGAVALVPNMLAVSLIREVGPVLTALVCTGKVGSAIGAEIGSMKITEQIDAMEVSGVDHYKYLVVSRIIALTFTLPLLTIYGFAVGLTGSFLAYNLEREISAPLFMISAFANMNSYDVIPSLVKSLFFGYTIALTGSFFGYKANKGAIGVGEAANATIFYSFLMIFFIDMLAAEITHYLTH